MDTYEYLVITKSVKAKVICNHIIDDDGITTFINKGEAVLSLRTDDIKSCSRRLTCVDYEY